MRFSGPMRFIAAVLALLILVQPPIVAAQQIKDYTQPKSHLPWLISPYTSTEVSATSFANSPKLEQLVKDGKIFLSLSDAIMLGLENNLDLAIARYNLSIADTDILRAKAGASVRGVATGLVQGTPGGGIGGFGAGAPGAGAGGTTGGAGGAGTGASGLVQSTLGAGAAVQSYDPVLNANLIINHAAFPLSNTVTTGVPAFQQNSGSADFNYQQAFPTGTSMTVGFNNDRITTNSRFSTLLPELSSNFRLTLRQRLLAGFGIESNTRFIRIARNNREISDIAFRNQVVATVVQIQNMYWDLVNAYEDARVRERSLQLAEKTLSDNKKQVEIGALAPIEVVRAESEVAVRSEDALLASTTLQLQQLLMKNAISRNLKDPVLAAAPVIPTDTMQLTAENDTVVPIQDLIEQALSSRPELSQARIDLTNRQITRRAVRNALLPTMDLIAWYGGSGLAGEQNPNNTGLPAGSVPRTGWNNAVARLFNGDFPDYAVGVQVSIPIRNRAAQADQVRSELEFRQAEIRFQQLQNQVGIEVRNAHFAVQQNRARVDTARKALDLARHTLDVTAKRMNLGDVTANEVLQAQRDAAVAESNLVTAMSTYQKSRIELDRVTGNVLVRNGIKVAEAERGIVEQAPVIPGVVPRQDLQQQ